MSQWSSPRLSSSPDNNKPSHGNEKSSISKVSKTSSPDYNNSTRHSSWHANGTPTKTNNTNGAVDGPRPTNFHESSDSTPPFPSSPPRYDRESSPVNADTPPGPAISSTANHSRSRTRTSSRPLSMVFTYSPHMMDVTEDTIPELQPIFHFLNGHANKLYQEGYFLKLDDQNTRMLSAGRSVFADSGLPAHPTCC